MAIGASAASLSPPSGQERVEVVLLLAVCLFAPFTLLACLALFRLAGCRRTDADGNPEAAESRSNRRGCQRQAVLLAWLAAAAVLAGAICGFGALRDWHFEAAPGDQLVMRLGGWAGLCGAVSLDAAKDDGGRQEVSGGEAPTASQLYLFNPGLDTDRWLTEPVNQSIVGQISSQEAASRQAKDISWELPVPGAVTSLTVTATFRHRIQLLLSRRPGLHRLSTMDSVGRGFDGYVEVQLVDEVHGINSVTMYNVSQSGSLTMRLACLENSHNTLSISGSSYAYTIDFKSVRYATDSVIQRGLACRIGQLPCLITNPPAHLIAQVADESPLSASRVSILGANRRRQFVLRCERRAGVIAATPGLLVVLVCAPCALVLIIDALLATRHCRVQLPGCQRSFDLCDGGATSAKTVDNKVSDSRLERQGVRFQLG